MRTVNLCFEGSPTGNFHFLANPLDRRQVVSMQIYVDGSLKFTTPDDILNAKILLTGGMHTITAKAWDERGAFSKTIDLLACTNNLSRTVKICLPGDGSSSNSPVHVVAAASTTLAFSQLQVYVDGVVRFHSSSKYVDISRTLSLGTHRITVKGWDSNGAFSSTVDVTVQ
jgi:archaellum component FlaF (FlaF/FlaG flagellin family)